jgi:hypothetical protein
LEKSGRAGSWEVGGGEPLAPDRQMNNG